ncbi:MAG: L,D-transpeptidase family protein [Pseudomonadota bacterium]
MRFHHVAAVLAVALAVSACAQPRAFAPTPQPQPAAPEPVAVAAKAETTRFQAMMDRHGVPMVAPKRGRAILVNIPSYELIALEDGEEAFRLPVIVGAPGADRETPVIDTVTSVARFLPTWRPTPTMIRTGAYEDGVRPPGRGNPLGLVALRLEPGMLVYLHDTNKPHLFERDRRALSWGCVRVEDIGRLITWALDLEPGDYEAFTAGRRTFDIPTLDLIPVMMRYYTSFPDASGTMLEHEDIYGRGRTVLRAPLSVSS